MAAEGRKGVFGAEEGEVRGGRGERGHGANEREEGAGVGAEGEGHNGYVGWSSTHVAVEVWGRHDDGCSCGGGGLTKYVSI